MKHSLIAAGAVSLLFIFGPLQGTFQAESIKVSPMDRGLEDVGCIFNRRNDKPQIYPLFISEPNGIWMNINGEVVTLTDLSEADNGRYQEYKSGDILIRIYSGKYRQYEGGVNYSRAKMTITIGDKTETIKLKGSCAC